MVLVGLIVTVFLLFEAAATGISTSGGHARGYSRPISTPHGQGEGIRLGASCAELLAKDYCDPRYHISFGDFAAHTPGSL